MGKKRKKKTIKEEKTMEKVNDIEVKEAEVIETTEEMTDQVQEEIVKGPVEEVTSEEVTENTTEEIQNDSNELIEELEEAIEPKTGKIVGCTKLNLRNDANAEAEVVTILEETDELFIDEINSTDAFYKVRTASGYEGYCMRDYVEIA